jgi:hypothetical protein
MFLVTYSMVVLLESLFGYRTRTRSQRLVLGQFWPAWIRIRNPDPLTYLNPDPKPKTAVTYLSTIVFIEYYAPHEV